MHNLRFIVALVLLAGIFSTMRAAEPAGAWTIESPEGAEVNLATGVASATNGIVVKYGGVTLTARRASVDQRSGQVVAEGGVRIERGGQLWEGERIEYNFKTGKVVGREFRSGQQPFFVGGDVLVGETKADVFVGAQAFVTTDDYENPNYRIKAKTLTVVPGEYIIARDAVLYLGKVPVFYFPYYRRSLKHHPNNLVLIPGYRSQWGPYLLSSYNWYWSDRLDGAVNVDGRLKRGVGFGPDLNWHLPRFGEGTFRYYYAKDDRPGEDFNNQDIDDDRQRVWIAHTATIRSNLTAKAVVRYQSDALIIRDFFESEYRDNVQPSSHLEVQQAWPNFVLDLLAQPRVNDFFETVERLPDVKLTGLRQQLGTSPFYYDSESTFGYYRRKFANDITNHFEAWRADTFHQVVLPRTFFNWLNVTPRVGGRFTHYSDVNGLGSTINEQDRGVFNTGAEMSFKASRVWTEARNRFWEIEGLRHIIEPSVNYVFVPDPTREPTRLPQFDYEVPTTRLLPIEYPDYNAIDSIDSQNVIRFGLRNKLQTKRNGQIENFVNWALYADWRLVPNERQRTFSDLYSDLDLSPFSWLTLSSETRYDLNEKTWNEANHRATLTPNNVWSLSIGHRYLRKNSVFIGPDSGNNLIYSTVYFRFNENWGARISHYFEARDGVMEEQQYTLYRDFRSWTTALTFRVRDPRDEPLDYTVALTASLKAFPRFGVGDDANKASLLLGR